LTPSPEPIGYFYLNFPNGKGSVLCMEKLHLQRSGKGGSIPNNENSVGSFDPLLQKGLDLFEGILY
jgi:hypothetical protein